MIVLFTDFGRNGPYIGQMEAAIYGRHPQARVINLFANAPGFNPRASAYLLAAYVHDFPAETVFLGVVDPGVGSTQRRPVVASIGHWQFVGPDNGLFDVVAKHAGGGSKREILWQPQRLSTSFHGRDLFAPVAAGLASGKLPSDRLGPEAPCSVAAVAADLCEVIYVDDYGNAMTGVRAATIDKHAVIAIEGVELTRARTFADVPQGRAFWYENANGLVEISVNRGSAAHQLSLAVGMPVELRAKR